jgi:TonB dependent receptor
VPSISVPSITGFSTNGYPSGYFQSSFNYKDVFSWIHRSHTIKLGGELRRMRGNSINTSNYIPTYTFASILTFAADTALSETRLVDPRTGIPAVNEVGLRDWEWALFVNDDWKVTPNFTLNVGLRYENYESPTEVNGLLRNLAFGSGPTLDQSLAGATAQTVQNFFPRGKGNIAPRFGFSWDPTGSGKTAIRGGFGIAYDRLFMTPLLNFRGNPPLRATATLGPIFGTAFTYSLGDPNKQYLGFPVDPALQLGLNAANGIKGARVAINAVDPTIKQAYTENFFFGIQRETWKGVVIEANYTGTAGHRLYNDYDINRYARDLLANGTFHGFNPYFSNVFMISSGSNSIYQGGSLLVKRSFRNGFTLHGSYTFSKAIDDTDTLTNIAVYEDSRNRRLDRARAGFDVRNRLSLNGVWELPFLRTQKGVAAQVVGGWQLSGMAIFQSGSPLSVINSAYPAGDYNADGTASDRPNTPGASVARGGFSKSQFLKGIFPAAAFPIPTAGTDGNLGRNVFSGPSYEEIDATLAKQFSLTERVKLQVRIEAFNVLNRVNLNPPSGDLSSANFGKATSTLIPRQFQGGLRLSF